MYHLCLRIHKLGIHIGVRVVIVIVSWRICIHIVYIAAQCEIGTKR